MALVAIWSWTRVPKVPGGHLTVLLKVSVYAEFGGWGSLAEGECRCSGGAGIKSVTKVRHCGLERWERDVGGTEPRISCAFLYFEGLMLMLRGELPQIRWSRLTVLRGS